jgi:hypothetical protein
MTSKLLADIDALVLATTDIVLAQCVLAAGDNYPASPVTLAAKDTMEKAAKRRDVLRNRIQEALQPPNDQDVLPADANNSDVVFTDKELLDWIQDHSAIIEYDYDVFEYDYDDYDVYEGASPQVTVRAYVGNHNDKRLVSVSASTVRDAIALARLRVSHKIKPTKG